MRNATFEREFSRRLKQNLEGKKKNLEGYEDLPSTTTQNFATDSAIINSQLNLPCFLSDKSLLVTKVLPAQILLSFSLCISYSMDPDA